MSKEYQPNYAVQPGETLKEVIYDRGILALEFSNLTGIDYNRLMGILYTGGEITIADAKKFEEVLGIPSTFWLNLERQYRKTLERLQKEGEK